MKIAIFGLYLLSGVTSQSPSRGCKTTAVRENINDASNQKFKKYMNAVEKMRSRGRTGKQLLRWNSLAREYKHSSDWSSEKFVEFNRMYLATVEDALQKEDGSVTIPYWIPSQTSDHMFSSTRFGTSKRGKCVNGPMKNMPFRQNVDEDLQCIIRHAQDVKLAKGFVKFNENSKENQEDVLLKKFKYVSKKFNGTYVLPTAAFDPLFLSHIAYLDAAWTQWESMNKKNENQCTDNEEELKYMVTGSKQSFRRENIRKAYEKIVKQNKCIVYRVESSLFNSE